MKIGKEIFRIALTFAIVASANAELQCRQVRPCKCSTEVLQKFNIFKNSVNNLYGSISYEMYSFLSNIYETAMRYLSTPNDSDFIELQRNIIFDWEMKHFRSRLAVYKSFLTPFSEGSEESRCWDCLITEITGRAEKRIAMKMVKAFELVLNSANTVCNQCSRSDKTEMNIMKLDAWFYYIKYRQVDIWSPLVHDKVKKLTDEINIVFGVDSTNPFFNNDLRTDEEFCQECFLAEEFKKSDLKSDIRLLSWFAHLINFSYFKANCTSCGDIDQQYLETKKTEAIKLINSTDVMKKSKPYNWNGVDYYAAADRFINYDEDSDLMIVDDNHVTIEEGLIYQEELRSVFQPYRGFCELCKIKEALGRPDLDFERDQSTFTFVLRNSNFGKECTVCSAEMNSKFLRSKSKLKYSISAIDRLIYYMSLNFPKLLYLQLDKNFNPIFNFTSYYDIANRSNENYLKVFERVRLTPFEVGRYAEYRAVSNNLLNLKQLTNLPSAICWGCIRQNLGFDQKNLDVLDLFYELANAECNRCPQGLLESFASLLPRLVEISKEMNDPEKQFITSYEDIYDDYEFKIIKEKLDEWGPILRYHSVYEIFYAAIEAARQSPGETFFLFNNRSAEDYCFDCFVAKYDFLHLADLSRLELKLNLYVQMVKEFEKLGECDRCVKQQSFYAEKEAEIREAVATLESKKSVKPFSWNDIDYFAAAQRFLQFGDEEDLNILKGNSYYWLDEQDYKDKTKILRPINDFCVQCTIGNILGHYEYLETFRALDAVLRYGKVTYYL